MYLKNFSIKSAELGFSRFNDQGYISNGPINDFNQFQNQYSGSNITDRFQYGFSQELNTGKNSEIDENFYQDLEKILLGNLKYDFLSQINKNNVGPNIVEILQILVSMFNFNHVAVTEIIDQKNIKLRTLPPASQNIIIKILYFMYMMYKDLHYKNNQSILLYKQSKLSSLDIFILYFMDYVPNNYSNIKILQEILISLSYLYRISNLLPELQQSNISIELECSNNTIRENLQFTQITNQQDCEILCSRLINLFSETFNNINIEMLKMLNDVLPPINDNTTTFQNDTTFQQSSIQSITQTSDKTYNFPTLQKCRDNIINKFRNRNMLDETEISGDDDIKIKVRPLLMLINHIDQPSQHEDVSQFFLNMKGLLPIKNKGSSSIQDSIIQLTKLQEQHHQEIQSLNDQYQREQNYIEINRMKQSQEEIEQMKQEQKDLIWSKNRSEVQLVNDYKTLDDINNPENLQKDITTACDKETRALHHKYLDEHAYLREKERKETEEISNKIRQEYKKRQMELKEQFKHNINEDREQIAAYNIKITNLNYQINRLKQQPIDPTTENKINKLIEEKNELIKSKENTYDANRQKLIIKTENNISNQLKTPNIIKHTMEEKTRASAPSVIAKWWPLGITAGGLAAGGGYYYSANTPFGNQTPINNSNDGGAVPPANQYERRELQVVQYDANGREISTDDIPQETSINPTHYHGNQQNPITSY